MIEQLTDITVKSESFSLNKQTGVIQSVNKNIDTKVTSSGGGGTVSRGGGYVAPTKVSSTTTTKTELWLLDEQGNEEAVQFAGPDIPFREEQKITIGYVSVVISKLVY